MENRPLAPTRRDSQHSTINVQIGAEISQTPRLGSVDSLVQVSPAAAAVDVLAQSRELRPFMLEALTHAMDRLDLPVTTQATSFEYFHQYWLFKTTQNPSLTLEHTILSAVCISLACRATEAHRKLRDILNAVYVSYHPSESFMTITEHYWHIRESMVKMEFIMLRILAFELQVDLPHPWITRICTVMMGSQTCLCKAICQLAITLASDVYKLSGARLHDPDLTSSYSSTTQTTEPPKSSPAKQAHGATDILTPGPRVMAVACVYIAIRTLQLDLPLEFAKYTKIWAGRGEESSVDLVERTIRLILMTLTSSRVESIPSSSDHFKYGNES